MSTRGEKLIFAQSMVAALEAQLLDSAGVSSVATDGLQVTIDTNLERKLEYWRKQEARYSGSGTRTATINLGKSHD